MREYEPSQYQIQEDENKAFLSQYGEDTTGTGHSQEEKKVIKLILLFWGVNFIVYIISH